MQCRVNELVHWSPNATVTLGDGETGRRGDGETGRRGDGETGRRGDGETGRRGDGETGRRGDGGSGWDASEHFLPTLMFCFIPLQAHRYLRLRFAPKHTEHSLKMLWDGAMPISSPLP